MSKDYKWSHREVISMIFPSRIEILEWTIFDNLNICLRNGWIQPTKEPINIEFTEQNADPENDIDFRWLDVQ